MKAAEKRNRAVAMMRDALDLLDDIREERAALHLQWAIDIAAGALVADALNQTRNPKRGLRG